MTSRPDIIDNRCIFITVIIFGLCYRYFIIRIFGQAQSVVVCLDSIISNKSGSIHFRAMPVFVNTSCSGFSKLIFTFAPYSKGDTGCCCQISLVSGINENLALILFLSIIITIQNVDFHNFIIYFFYIMRTGIELPHCQNCD